DYRGTLYLSDENMISLGISPGDGREVIVGNQSVSVKILSGTGGKTATLAAELTSELARLLLLPPGLTLNIIRYGDKLRFGPLIGILAASYYRERKSFGGQDGYFRSLLKYLQSINGFGYVFTHQGLDWNQGIINGYYLDDRNKWKPATLPFPNVCYNRYLPNRPGIDSRETMTRFLQFGVKSFNTPLGSKWNVIKNLSVKKEIAPYLPGTQMLNSLRTLDSMLSEFGEVYIKALNGHLGKGVIVITKVSNGYIVKTTSDYRGVLVKGLSQAFKQSKLNRCLRKMIVQQSIKVMGKNQHFDVRILIQKDRKNAWQVTGMAARVGRTGKITTNLHTGGRAESIETILVGRGFDKRQVILIKAKLEWLSITIAKALEEYTTVLGDLGLDFVIDREGKPWFLEANPRAGRRAFSGMDRETRRLAAGRPMEYAAYLAGF
ncbi:MAG: YheC/YheD family protein, partial [Chitinophagales bacterium]